MSHKFGGAHKRLVHDFDELQSAITDGHEKLTGISAAPTDQSMLNWIAIIEGVEDTIWQGGKFRLSLKFSDCYPNEPPAVKFLSNIYHPNVYQDGDICLDVLQQEWTPAIGVRSLLLILQQLLDEPNTDSPTNAIASQEYENDYETYCEKVREMIQQNKKDQGGSSSAN